jgi:large subunit ribosomal protein L34e
MPMPKDRSNSVRKVKRRMPGNKPATRYVRRLKGKSAACATCGGKLQATHHSRAVKPSLRTPNRKFGGMLCANCTRRVIILQTRINEGAVTLDSVDVKFLPYVKKG